MPILLKPDHSSLELVLFPHQIHDLASLIVFLLEVAGVDYGHYMLENKDKWFNNWCCNFTIAACIHVSLIRLEMTNMLTEKVHKKRDDNLRIFVVPNAITKLMTSYENLESARKLKLLTL